jgi:poly(A) polymerase
MVGFGDGEWRHKDVWKHTKQVVRQAVPRLEVRWAALFHDIGKVKTRSIAPDGKVHFLGHAEVGTRMFDKLDRRTGLFAPSRRSRTPFASWSCTTFAPTSIPPTGPTVRSAFRARARPSTSTTCFCLARADITTKRPEKKRRGLQQIEELGSASGARRRGRAVAAAPERYWRRHHASVRSGRRRARSATSSA